MLDTISNFQLKEKINKILLSGSEIYLLNENIDIRLGVGSLLSNNFDLIKGNWSYYSFTINKEFKVYLISDTDVNPGDEIILKELKISSIKQED